MARSHLFPISTRTSRPARWYRSDTGLRRVFPGVTRLPASIVLTRRQLGGQEIREAKPCPNRSRRHGARTPPDRCGGGMRAQPRHLRCAEARRASKRSATPTARRHRNLTSATRHPPARRQKAPLRPHRHRAAGFEKQPLLRHTNRGERVGREDGKLHSAQTVQH